MPLATKSSMAASRSASRVRCCCSTRDNRLTDRSTASIISRYRSVSEYVTISGGLGMLETNYDVVVVGARCAGSSLARLTAQAGLRTLAVDSKVAETFGATEYCVRPSHDSGVYAYYENIDLHELIVGFGKGSLVLAIPTNDRQVCVAVSQHSRRFPGLHAGGDVSVLQVA